MKLITLLMAVTAYLIVSSTFCIAQSLIQNGSFETLESPVAQQQVIGSGSTTFIAPWTVTGYGGVKIANSTTLTSVNGPAQDGMHYVDLNDGATTHGYLYQDFYTVPNMQYSLKFYIGSSSSDPEPTISFFLFEDSVGYKLNATLTPLAAIGRINWLEEEFTFTGSENKFRLEFQDKSTFYDHTSFLDNVSITEIPEPTILFPVGLIIVALFKQR